MAEKITVQAMTYIGAEVATKRLNEIGIKFSAHQRKIIVASFTSVFVGGAATALRMLADGHDLSDIQTLANDISAEIDNAKQ